MNEMVKMTDSSISMTSREIAELVESRHNDVKRSIERLMEKGVIQSTPMANFKNINNVEGQEYVFSGDKGKRDSIIVVAQLSPEFTARLVDRWQELEIQHSARLPQSFSEALILAGKIQAELEQKALIVAQQQVQIEEYAPKAAVLDEITANEDLVLIDAACNVLSVKPIKFRAWMRKRGFLRKDGCKDLPSAYMKKMGYMDAKTEPVTTDKYTGVSIVPMFTHKGIAKMAEWLAEYKRVDPKGFADIYDTDAKKEKK